MATRTKWPTRLTLVSKSRPALGQTERHGIDVIDKNNFDQFRRIFEESRSTTLPRIIVHNSRHSTNSRLLKHFTVLRKIFLISVNVPHELLHVDFRHWSEIRTISRDGNGFLVQFKINVLRFCIQRENITVERRVAKIRPRNRNFLPSDIFQNPTE